MEEKCIKTGYKLRIKYKRYSRRADHAGKFQAEKKYIHFNFTLGNKVLKNICSMYLQNLREFCP